MTTQAERNIAKKLRVLELADASLKLVDTLEFANKLITLGNSYVKQKARRDLLTADLAQKITS